MFEKKIPNQCYMKPAVLFSHISKTVGHFFFEQSAFYSKYDGDPVPLRLMLLNDSKTNTCQVKILTFMVFIKKAIMMINNNET